MSRRGFDMTLDFLRSLDGTTSVEGVKEILDKHLNRYGIETYMAGAVHGTGARPREQLDQALLDTMPDDWKRRYMAHGYMFKDPTIRRLGLSREPFGWDEALTVAGDDKDARRVLREAGDFGMAQGVTVPLATLDGHLAGFSFSGRRVELAPAELDILHVIATYAFAQLLKIRDASLELPQVVLAPREREALQWAAEGKTAWEIGQLMSISEKGVEYHLRAVRVKLGTVNSVQSVAIALRHGLID